ncbi:winged helix DNA-binding domain-containing protein [Actinopolymorpha sp. B11F2]|uniref:winged helix DNA-binding domain-containing protein n=1 Tax=Actinopolymorpha sp. B11F2 TaxID=3160862 RepID=UPI0032E4C72B
MSDVLTTRALNRATLERQLLLRRWRLPALDAVERVAGLQAQAPFPPYYGLWSRLVDFRPEELADLLTTRQVVRIVLMRSTIHLVSAGDCRLLRPLVQVVSERGLSAVFGRTLDGLELEEVAKAGRALVDERPLTFAELGAQLREQWPDRDASALAQVVRAKVPLVQVPPRAIWGAGGLARHTSAESWLGAPMDPQPALAELVRRYLAAFGPATVADIAKWSGLTKLGEVVDGIRPELRTYRDERGRELVDLPDAPRPDPDTPAPVRYVAEFDNLLLAHADRTRVIADEHWPRIYTVNGIFPGTVLVDGFVRGTWRIVKQRGNVTLRVDPFVRLTKRDQATLGKEGERLLAFAAPDAEARDIEVSAAG